MSWILSAYRYSRKERQERERQKKKGAGEIDSNCKRESSCKTYAGVRAVSALSTFNILLPSYKNKSIYDLQYIVSEKRW
jgi:hypothetical protein